MICCVLFNSNRPDALKSSQCHYSKAKLKINCDITYCFRQFRIITASVKGINAMEISTKLNLIEWIVASLQILFYFTSSLASLSCVLFISLCTMVAVLFACKQMLTSLCRTIMVGTNRCSETARRNFQIPIYQRGCCACQEINYFPGENVEVGLTRLLNECGIESLLQIVFIFHTHIFE
jgi:hypothetical protein